MKLWPRQGPEVMYLLQYIRNCFSFLFAVLSLLPTPASSLSITHFHVPAFVDLKREAALECVFDLSQREELHSVKWYRTGASNSMEEFYTYSPSRNPPAKNHRIRGIRVDVSAISACQQRSTRGGGSEINFLMCCFSEPQAALSSHSNRNNLGAFPLYNVLSISRCIVS